MQTHKYLVVSPEITVSYGFYEPPETGACAVEVEAPNARQAKSEALRRKEMQDWVREARGDNRNPFADLDAEIMHCEHGVCLCWNDCVQCNAELDRLEAEWYNENLAQ